MCWLTFLYCLCTRTNWQNKRETGRALLPLDGLYKAPSSCPGAPRVGDHSIVWSPSDPSQIRPCYKINSGGIITWNISLISANVLIFLVFLDKFQTTMKKVFFFLTMKISDQEGELDSELLGETELQHVTRVATVISPMTIERRLMEMVICTESSN